MSSVYIPKPGSVPERAIGVLRTLPVGERISTAELAKALGLKGGGLQPLLQTAVNRGALRREVLHAHQAVYSLPEQDVTADDWPTQTIVPASQAKPLKTGPSSVFDLACRAMPPVVGPAAAVRPRRDDGFDPAAVPIKSGLTIEPLPKRLSRYAQLLDRMAPGDCVDLPAWRARGLLSHAKTLGVRMARRQVGEGAVRMWRLP